MMKIGEQVLMETEEDEIGELENVVNEQSWSSCSLS